MAIPFLKYFLRRTYGIVLRKNKLLSSPAQRFIAIIEARARRDRSTSAARTRSPSEVRDVELGAGGDLCDVSVLERRRGQ